MTPTPQQKERKTGTVIEALPNTLFRVTLKDGGETIIGYLAGKMRFHRIRVLVGDNVEIEMDPYNPEKGKIVRRF